MRGTVVKLDKSLPLVKVEDKLLRCEYSAEFSKKHTNVAIGDIVEIDRDPACETGIITQIAERGTKLIRNDPVNRGKEQILAANFDCIAICNTAKEINIKHILRELAIAKNAGTKTILILTKSDLENDKKMDRPVFNEILRCFDDVFKTRVQDLKCTIEKLSDSGYFEPSSPLELFAPNTTTVLLGKSGVGKSSLVNAIAEKQILSTGEVREYDDKGRHTTVAREIVALENGIEIVDMPGVRALGLINCERGIEETFDEISELALSCKFRDCKHISEPGCAVRGNVDDIILQSFHELVDENDKKEW